MSDNLIKLVDTDQRDKMNEMDDLDTIHQSLQEYNKSENAAHLEVIRNKLQERPGLIGRLFPTKAHVRLEELSIQWMEDNFRHKQEIASLLMNVLLEKLRLAGHNHILSLKQKYEGQLIQQGIDIHAELEKHVLTKLEEMSNDLSKKMRSFNENIIMKEAEAERCKHISHLYERVTKFIKFESSNFYDISEELLQKYRGLLSISLDENFRRLTQEA